MDQPTNLELRITGTEQSVAPAAEAAARIIAKDSPSEYFEQRVQNMLEGNIKATADPDIVAFALNRESYWAVAEEDISAIADEIIQASPEVTLHLSARITMTYEEGYDTCVDINYASGERTVNVSYDEYDAEEKDRIRKILDAIGEENAEELADENYVFVREKRAEDAIKAKNDIKEKLDPVKTRSREIQAVLDDIDKSARTVAAKTKDAASKITSTAKRLIRQALDMIRRR
jgi:hypothetical protein